MHWVPIATVVLFLLCVPAFCDVSRGIELRRQNKLKEATAELRGYGQVADFDRLKATEQLEFLRGVLELAHVRVLQNDVPGALPLLNWAEGRKDDFQRTLAALKYAEILINLGESERAADYLDQASEVVGKYLRGSSAPSGTAIGQGSEAADTLRSWRDRRDELDALRAELEAEKLQKEFNTSYASYVKMRRLQMIADRAPVPRYRREAIKLADELIMTDPSSQFSAAAGYLKGELLAGALNESSAKKEIAEVKAYLEKFVKAQPDGLYRGETLMLLGRLSLEREWNATEAEKYYLRALEYFRRSRTQRDALNLYAPLSDELRKQTEPTRRPASLDQWRRMVYHVQDPLKLYNAAAPVWYVDDREKNCLFLTGFFAFLNGRFETAGKIWDEAGKLDENLRELGLLNAPSVVKRLQAACRQGFLVVDAQELREVTRDERLRILFAEFRYLEERFGESRELWRALGKTAGVTPSASAIALLGEGDCLRLLPNCDPGQVGVLYRRVLEEKPLAATPAAARAAYNLAWLTLQATSKNRLAANELFERCIRKYPKSKYAEAASFYLAVINLGADPALGEKYAESYRRKYPKGIYLERLELRRQQLRDQTVRSAEK